MNGLIRLHRPTAGAAYIYVHDDRLLRLPNAVKACVTGATGFLGAHVAAKLVARGYEVRVTVRDPRRMAALSGVEVEPVVANALDRASMRSALSGCELLIHTAGMVASNPRREVWRTNAVGPRIAVETAADVGVERVVVTSSVAAVGPAPEGRGATERNPYPHSGTGMTYPDTKHEGELAAFAAGERLGVDVVAVNPSYVLGVALNRTLPGETSTRIIGNYMRGRLPAIVDSYSNVVDVEDVAEGHLLAADKGKPGERYILGGENMRWSEVMERVVEISGIHHPLLVLPAEMGRAAAVAQRFGVPMSMLEGIRLMAPDWRYSSAKAKRALGYRPRNARDTLERTVAWYMELIEDDRFGAKRRNALDWMSASLRVANRVGLLSALRVAGGVAGRKVVIS